MVSSVMPCQVQQLRLHTGEEESAYVTLKRKREIVLKNRNTERETEKETLMSPCNGCPGKQALATVISRLMMSAVLFN